MLYSEIEERARRFRLALRMGIPILLLIVIAFLFLLRQTKYQIFGIDIAIFVTILFISVYFLFFLISLNQNETVIDPMTSAFNRSFLLKILKKEFDRNEHYTAILMRIDNLSFINDHYGIDRADRLLKIFIHLLDEYLKMEGVKNAVIGRYHGSDFIVGLPLSKVESYRKIDTFITTYREIDTVIVEVRYTGVQKGEGKAIDSLIRYLYDSLTQEMKKPILQEKSGSKRLNIDQLEQEIIAAIEAEKLLLHYIPSLNVKSGNKDLFEVGVRLMTENSGTLPPKKFIPVVNRLGLERKFDTALFRTIGRDLRQVSETIHFSCNISPFSLRDEAFVEAVTGIMTDEGIDSQRIIFELFENRPVKDVRRYRMILEDLRSLGFRFALDNFGGPNAALEYIKTLPVDMVQFDKEFTVSSRRPGTAALLEGYLTAFRQMQVKTLLKWVDNEETFARFKSLGVDYMQGFFISNRPLDSVTLIKKYGVDNAIR